MEVEENKYYDEKYDLENCSKEPIHRILRTQAYGSFIICNFDWSDWMYASSDVADDLVSKSVGEIIFEMTGVSYQEVAESDFDQEHFFSKDDHQWAVVVHKRDFGFMIEIEPISRLSQLTVHPEKCQDATVAMMNCKTIKDLWEEVTARVRDITGFGHIMIYAFDEDYSGQVVAERKPDEAVSYMGLKFPASDIPEQARNLYFVERVRAIHNTTSDGNVLVKQAEASQIDLNTSKVSMRGVSPIHAEYLRNIGVHSSCSVAIIDEGKLWGLIACHNPSPVFIGYKTRGWLRFLSDFISGKKKSISNYLDEIVGMSSLLSKNKILDNLASSQDLSSSLLEGENNIQDLIQSSGAIVVTNGSAVGCGEVPESAKLQNLIAWLDGLGKFDVKAIDQSNLHLPEDTQSPLMAGMLIVQLSHLSGDYLIWLRKEKAMEVSWAGDPTKNKSFDHVKGRLTPRKSFDRWKEIVADRAEPWNEKEIATAKVLKGELREHLYHRFNQMAALNKELKEAYNQMEIFSYSVSHDLKAPLRSIEGFSQILKEDYASQLDEHGLYILNIISDSIAKMNAFIHEILNYSKLNKSELDIMKVDLNEVFRSQWTILNSNPDANNQLIFDNGIPDVYGDLNMLNQLILNLLSNSIKYVAHDVDPIIRVTYKLRENYVDVYLEDNGIGIDESQREKVFEVFRRLVKEDDYEGTGVGLSIVKKVIQRHGGEIVVKDRLDGKQGSRFEFSLPVREDFEKKALTSD